MKIRVTMLKSFPNSDAGAKQNQDPDWEGTLKLLQELIHSVREGVKMDCLHTSISMAMNALDDGSHNTEDCAVLLRCLMRGLLTRYGIHMWIEDLDECLQRSPMIKTFNDGIIHRFMDSASNGFINAVKADEAAQLIQVCRKSINADLLNTIICVAIDTLSSYSSSRETHHKAKILSILGHALLMRYLAFSRFADLDEAAVIFRLAEHISKGDATLSYICLVSLLYVQWLQFLEGRNVDKLLQMQQYLDRADGVDEGKRLVDIGNGMVENAIDDTRLQEGIALLTSSLRLRAIRHPRRWFSLQHLADAHYTRSERLLSSKDLDRCIGLLWEALDLCPSPHLSRSTSLNQLARALLSRFKQYGVFQDLEQAIGLHREALDLRPAGHSDRFISMNNLALALTTRFQHKGAFKDLDESIILFQDALDLLPARHPHRSESLNNLANVLITRFKKKGAFEDLSEAILLHQEGLELRPAPDPDRSGSLNNLGIALQIRFQQRGSCQDLDESILLHREALKLRPAPHRYRSESLTNLASALFVRFQNQRVFQDLDESIVLYQESLNLRPSPHPGRSISVNNLINAYYTRFDHKGTFEDLDKSIELGHEALELRPYPHPDRSGSLNNLANAFLSRFEQKGERRDIEKALDLYKQAVEYPTGSLMDRLIISKQWTSCAQKHLPALSLDAYVCSMKLLPQLVSLDLTLQQRQTVLEHTRDFVGEAAKCAILVNKYDMAVTFLSTGRSLFWSQTLQLRTPVNKLAISHPALAEKFVTVSSQLENASYSGLSASCGINTPDNQGAAGFASLYALADQRQRIIEEIRGNEGFERFLLPPSFLSLQGAAKSGPIVILNGSDDGCDALVMCKTGSVTCIPLEDISSVELKAFGMFIHMLLRPEMTRRDIDIPVTIINTLQQSLGRDMVSSSLDGSSEEMFRPVLAYLWIKIVWPIIKKLGIQKTDSPGRIWWCPTGPFTSLPIHAAGIYSGTDEAVDCLFQYAVSSYCTSPQDLLHPSPPITRAFKMTAVIEPEAEGAIALPATHEELGKIATHIPDEHNLIVHVGSHHTPTQAGRLLLDIQQSSFVHFGCHGTQNLINPLESSLILSGGRLTMSMVIKECKVPEGALAYLSACETAKGDEARPDESLNLVATMMFAGFRSVVGTLWSIMDDDAPIVAEAFYRHLFRHGKDAPPDVRDAAYGLHLGAKELRERGRSFYSWVPYVHYGI